MGAGTGNKVRKSLAVVAVAAAGSWLSGCGGSDLVNDAAKAIGISTSYQLGGTVSGLGGTGLKLEDNGGSSLGISGNGAFTFTQSVASGANYSVSVQSQPSGQTCTVSNGSGTIGEANVANVMVSCTGNAYTVGGAVSSLTGQGLVLEDNGGDSLTISGNGSFTFPTALSSGTAYGVTVALQPGNPAQSCSVTNGTGTVGQANVTKVTVTCVSPALTAKGTAAGQPVSQSISRRVDHFRAQTATGLAF